MTKSKNFKLAKSFKGLSLAFAGMFALTVFPADVIKASADLLLSGSVGSEAIYISNGISTANKGSIYDIRAAYFGSNSKIPVGLGDYSDYYTVDYTAGNAISAITSSVSVTYKSTGQEIAVQKKDDATIKQDIANPASAVYGSFTMDNAGEYVITYQIDLTVNGSVKSFSTDYSVISEVSNAYFEFNANDAQIIPSVYDIKMAGNKDIEVPLPKVFNSKEEEIKNLAFIINSDDTMLGGATEYVDITVSGGDGKEMTLAQTEGKFLVEGKNFDPNDAVNFKGYGNYSIKYSYYVGGQFITSITKDFKVNQEYYSDYELVLVAETSPTTAVTGVELTLPKITGKTGAKTTPANEAVSISYDVQAFRKVGSSYTETKEGSIVDGKFTPWVDGLYRITYTAKDFYGNTQTKDFFLDNVKDTQKPVAKVYDASNAENFNADGSINEYIDASSLLKSKASTENVIIYAIGATDNVSKPQNMTLTRVVKTSSKSIEIEKSNQAYKDYNIIFDYNFSTLFTNNIALAAQIPEADKASEASVLAWLKANKYLIVTSDSTKTIEEGYAYIDYEKVGSIILNASKDGTPYTVLYYAKDEAGNESVQLSYQMTLVDGYTVDTELPKITFPTNLKNSYRANSIITFEAPSASDDNDTRMEVISEYAFKAGDHAYDYYQFEDGKYKIDLSEIDNAIYDQGKPTSVVIRVYATDDDGNKGEWSKEIAIADVQDKELPTIKSEAYITPNTTPIKQNTEVILPTLTLTDDNVSYLNSQIYVNRIDEKGNKTPITVKGKKEVKDSLKKTYTLEAGKFIASYEGNYEVKVVISDAGNNQITTFYNYQAEGVTFVENPVITGLSSVLGTDGKAEVGKAIDLGTPSVEYTLKEGYDIFGVTKDDSKSAFDFSVQVVNNSPSAYEFNSSEENTFTAYETGPYQLQYFVNIAIYDTTLFNEDGVGVLYTAGNNDAYVMQAENKDLAMIGKTSVRYAVSTDTDFKLYDLSSSFSSDEIGMYKELNGKRYYVEFADGLKLATRTGEELPISITENSFTINGIAQNLPTPTSIHKDAFRAYNLKSDVMTLTVSDTTAPEMLVDYNYPKTAVKGTDIQIKKIEAADLSAKGINPDKSYVLVSYKGGETSYSSQFYLSKWNKEEHGADFDEATGNIKYNLSRDGNYTIAYHVYDHSGNVNSEKSYSIAVGDCQSPEIKLENNFIEKKYKLNDTLTIDLSKLTFTDNKTLSEELAKTLKIVVRNTSTKAELSNTANSEEHRYSFKLDTAGTYEIEISVTDEAGWTTTKTEAFEVSTDAAPGTETYQIVGTVLIVVAVLILAGVITYFVVSKVKRDKKAKAKNPESKNSKKKSKK